MALSPLAPVFLSMACLDMACKASVVISKFTWQCHMRAIGQNRLMTASMRMDTNLVHMEESLILRNESIARFSQNTHQHLLSQVVEGNDDREAANEFWDHAEINQVPGFSLK